MELSCMQENTVCSMDKMIYLMQRKGMEGSLLGVANVKIAKQAACKRCLSRYKRKISQKLFESKASLENFQRMWH